MNELEQIKGIGAAMAEALAGLTPPVETLQDLIDWETDALAEHVEGASVDRVMDWQAQAIMLLAARTEAAAKAEEEEEISPSVPSSGVGDGKIRVWVHAREGRFLPQKGLGSRLYGEYFLVSPDLAARLMQADPAALRLDRPENADQQD